MKKALAFAGLIFSMISTAGFATEIKGDGPLVKVFKYTAKYSVPDFHCAFPTDDVCGGEYLGTCEAPRSDRKMKNDFGDFAFDNEFKCAHTERLFDELKRGLIKGLNITVDFTSRDVLSVDVLRDPAQRASLDVSDVDRQLAALSKSPSRSAGAKCERDSKNLDDGLSSGADAEQSLDSKAGAAI